MVRLLRKLRTFLRRRGAEPDAEPSYLYRSDIQCESDWEELSEAADRRMRRRAVIEKIWSVPWGLLVAIPSFIARRLNRRTSTPPELDEHGFPVDWRRAPTFSPATLGNLEQTSSDWAIFERWCEERSYKAFAASPETVLKFLTDPSVDDQRIADVYWAIDCRHDAYYWNEDANPCYYVDRCYGVEVAPDGTLTFADHWRIFDWWSRERGFVAYPASPDTVLAFLREPPLSGPNLYRVWTAIGERHQDANPCHALEREFGVSVAPDGTVSIPAGVPDTPTPISRNSAC